MNSIFRFSKSSDHIFITLSFIVSINNVFRFPALLSESGGDFQLVQKILFFIPYFLCLVFVTTPIIYLENALGQYSSLPPVQLFAHLCPGFSGKNTLLFCHFYLKKTSIF
ncbi:unnamed protein product [Thelazia callipaeda]|uniref:Uncharacterized protein n=1 Tax=Thelazia callipaeda TaxID=103827 RepID=A0A0N5DBH4_THECL|nr:unnamed protein product [Thelazia callipaeda]